MDNDQLDIQESFEKTLINSELPDVVIDLAEISLDNLIDLKDVKDLPLIKTFVGLLEFGANVHDRLFLKKIIAFLANLHGVDVAERKKMIRKINDSNKYRIHVGEKLLYIIDRCNDYESAEMVSRLFGAFIEGKIEYSDYLIAAEAISFNPASDVKWFIEEYNEWINIDDLNVPLHTGLFTIRTEEVNVDVENEDDHKALLDGAKPLRANVSGGGVWAQPSRAGKVIYEVLADVS